MRASSMSQRDRYLLFGIGRAAFQFIVGSLEDRELFPRQDLPGTPKLDKECADFVDGVGIIVTVEQDDRFTVATGPPSVRFDEPSRAAWPCWGPAALFDKVVPRHFQRPR